MESGSRLFIIFLAWFLDRCSEPNEGRDSSSWAFRSMCSLCCGLPMGHGARVRASNKEHTSVRLQGVLQGLPEGGSALMGLWLNHDTINKAFVGSVNWVQNHRRTTMCDSACEVLQKECWLRVGAWVSYVDRRSRCAVPVTEPPAASWSFSCNIRLSMELDRCFRKLKMCFCVFRHRCNFSCLSSE